MTQRQATDPFNVVITGMGGQGVLTLGRALASAAAAAGWRVTGSEKRGGAQRGGAAEVVLRLIPPDGPPESALSAAVPPGELDLLVGLEPVEAWRRVPLTSGRTLVLLDTTPIEPALARHTGYRTPPFAEVATGVAGAGARVVAIDLMAAARGRWGHGVLGNLVALGWLAASGALPFGGAGLKAAATAALGAKGMHEGAWAHGVALAAPVEEGVR